MPKRDFSLRGIDGLETGSDRSSVAVPLLSRTKVDQSINRRDRNAALVSEADQFVAGGHVSAVTAANLAQHSSRLQASQPHQVHGGFRVPLPFEHASVASNERKHMPRAIEVGGEAIRIHDRLD